MSPEVLNISWKITEDIWICWDHNIKEVTMVKIELYTFAQLYTFFTKLPIKFFV